MCTNGLSSTTTCMNIATKSAASLFTPNNTQLEVVQSEEINQILQELETQANLDGGSYLPVFSAEKHGFDVTKSDTFACLCGYSNSSATALVQHLDFEFEGLPKCKISYTTKIQTLSASDPPIHGNSTSIAQTSSNNSNARKNLQQKPVRLKNVETPVINLSSEQENNVTSTPQQYNRCIFIIHEKDVSKPNHEYYCTCGVRFLSAFLFNFHLSFYKDRKFICAICGDRLKSKATLKAHFTRLHKNKKQALATIL